MNDPEKCTHANWDDYFERCEDCNTTLDQLPQELQDEWHKQFIEETDEITKLQMLDEITKDENTKLQIQLLMLDVFIESYTEADTLDERAREGRRDTVDRLAPSRDAKRAPRASKLHN